MSDTARTTPSPPKPGRPRSAEAREAVLHAVDDMLVEEGYAAMTIKGIAERAGVGRQTVYRWWSTKAEILMEATTIDAAEALRLDPADEARDALDTRDALLGFLRQWRSFLCDAPSGIAYRALIGEAQHDASVRELVQNADVIGIASRRLLDSVASDLPGLPSLDLASDQLTGPLLSHVLTRPSPPDDDFLTEHVETLLRAWA
ncbi:TetR/AcrR family transcriptional regulator [Plantibacter sp. YIM 135249]|uniref:TetR/AcrR family transcriptional regulator n=1 Tax=Plantibacter sp. YIM 135249 TaxID=3423918 RepID=UPI003D33F1A6